MAIYAIGDIQGCFLSLQKLLEKIQFNSKKDTLWFAGDLVNRGPDSLETLRFVKNLGDSAISVLGNHDLHLLAIAEGVKPNKDASIKQVLEADDASELLHWLRHRPLMHYDKSLKVAMSHAGIYPLWKIKQARKYAQELEAVLRSDSYTDFIHNMYGDLPDCWDEDLTGKKRLRFICNAFTRMRYCYKNGTLNLKDNGPPGSQTPKTHPWFNLNPELHQGTRIVFGHWSTLGLLYRKDIFSLDTGCLWGGYLSALRLDEAEFTYTMLECPNYKKPPI
jgi:bis(5'-nucleosyl)-tetraphosphatase (symmetrical)